MRDPPVTGPQALVVVSRTRRCCESHQEAPSSPNNSRQLHAPDSGMSHAQAGDMKLTQPILKTISYQLCHGNPWWAFVVLNEYVEPSSPLHDVLVRLFRRRVPIDSMLATRLYAGARYHDLSPEERAYIGARASITRPLTQVPFRGRGDKSRHGTRRLPSRRARGVTHIHSARLQKRSATQMRERVISTASLAAPVLRVVSEAARRSS